MSEDALEFWRILGFFLKTLCITFIFWEIEYYLHNMELNSVLLEWVIIYRCITKIKKIVFAFSWSPIYFIDKRQMVMLNVKKL